MGPSPHRGRRDNGRDTWLPHRGSVDAARSLTDIPHKVYSESAVGCSFAQHPEGNDDT